jgi:hypothetical protein
MAGDEAKKIAIALLGGAIAPTKKTVFLSSAFQENPVS